MAGGPGVTLYYDFDVQAVVRDIVARRAPPAAAPLSPGKVSQVSPATRGVSPDPTTRLSREPGTQPAEIKCSHAGTPGEPAEVSQESPLSPLTAPQPHPAAGLTFDEIEDFEERAAILEFDEGLTRLQADRLALTQILARRR
jgi:hypothetical protein